MALSRFLIKSFKIPFTGNRKQLSVVDVFTSQTHFDILRLYRRFCGRNRRQSRSKKINIVESDVVYRRLFFYENV